MKNLYVLKYPDDKLRLKCRAVTIDKIGDPETQELIVNLIHTLYIENGVGLAAPQVGDDRRIIVLDVGNGPCALINPKIVSASIRKTKSREGCLSIPGTNGIVKRHRSIHVVAFSKDGKEISFKASGLLSIVIQHEIDHLDGILFIDKATNITCGAKKL
jgi:peptide deformylase